MDGEEDPTKLTRFANYLRIVLPGSDPLITELAAKALGRLATPGGTLTSEFVEFEVKRALEWLQGFFNSFFFSCLSQVIEMNNVAMLPF